MRRVNDEQMINVLNLAWSVPDVEPGQGVWATIEFRVNGATLSIYDQAPDAHERRCLAKYLFPLKESVHPLRGEFQSLPASSPWVNLLTVAIYSLARARMALSTMF